MSQKRVAVVLASLVGTLTISAGILLMMEGGTVAGTPAAVAYDDRGVVASQIEPSKPLQRGGWTHIIIYESGDVAGDVASLADGRVVGESNPTSKTERSKANFHFVIDSGKSRRVGMDGALEVGTAWKNQEAGAPCFGWPDVRYNNVPPYKTAVGVCFIGDLSREPISKAQDVKLVQVVRLLQKSLNIPREHILFQWEVEPALTHPNPRQLEYAEAFRANLN